MCQLRRQSVTQGIVRQYVIVKPDAVQGTPAVRLGELRPQEHIPHDLPVRQPAAPVREPERGAQGGARIPRCRLDKDLPVIKFATDATVGDTVVGHAPGHAEILLPGQAVQVTGHVHERLLQDELGAGGNITVALY